MGLASGPFLVAWLLEVADYATVINVSSLVVALSVPAMLLPAWRLDRAR
jgi:hypothetical protein